MKLLIKILETIVVLLSLFVIGITMNESFRNDIRNFIYTNFDLTLNIDKVNNVIDKQHILYDGSNYINDSTYCIYYEMLNDSQKQLYAQIVENIENYNNEFPTIVSLDKDEVNDILIAIFNDHPEYFWLDTNYTYSYSQNDNTVKVITLSFNETINYIDNAKDIFNNAINEIVNGAIYLSSDLEKEKYVHDKLIELIQYDENSSMNQSSYSAIVNHSTVCAGYSKSFQYIMKQLNIPTYNVIGIADNEDHSWNIILLDGEYYNVDLTWDDQQITIYSFFNVPDYEFNETHTRSGLSTNLPTCEGEKYKNKNLGYIEPYAYN